MFLLRYEDNQKSYRLSVVKFRKQRKDLLSWLCMVKSLQSSDSHSNFCNPLSSTQRFVNPCSERLKHSGRRPSSMHQSVPCVCRLHSWCITNYMKKWVNEWRKEGTKLISISHHSLILWCQITWDWNAYPNYNSGYIICVHISITYIEN